MLFSAHSAVRSVGKRGAAAVLTSERQCAGPDGEQRQDQVNSSGCICRTLYCFGVLPQRVSHVNIQLPCCSARETSPTVPVQQRARDIYGAATQITHVVAVAGSPAIMTCSFRHKQLGSTQQSSPVPERLLSLLQ